MRPMQERERVPRLALRAGVRSVAAVLGDVGEGLRTRGRPSPARRAGRAPPRPVPRKVASGRRQIRAQKSPAMQSLAADERRGALGLVQPESFGSGIEAIASVAIRQLSRGNMGGDGCGDG
jgi:hypothetical protein